MAHCLLGEDQVAVIVAQVMQLNDYEIVSKCVYGASGASKKFGELGGGKISGSFDLIVKDNKSGLLTGIEVKVWLNSKAFHRALGQCVDYLAKGPDIKNAVIYCASISPRYKRICQDTINKFNLPISIEILPSANWLFVLCLWISQDYA